MAKKLNKLPGVLSFQRCLLVTDGLFYNELDNGNLSPLWVIRHGIRGTQNINKASKEGQAASASAKREEVSNIQTTDSAKLDANASALQVRFNLRGMDIKKALFACAPGQKDSIDDLNAFKADLAAFVDRAKESEALVHLACRYVRNIANGRFLWRNRTVASSATVEVLLPDGTKKMFDALATPFNHFEEVSDDERAVTEVLACGWKGDPATELRVTAHVDLGVGGAVEVFPSQNYLENKNKTRGFARPLYCVGGAPDGQDQHSVRIMGQAALRDQDRQCPANHRYMVSGLWGAPCAAARGAQRRKPRCTGILPQQGRCIRLQVDAPRERAGPHDARWAVPAGLHYPWRRLFGE